MYLDLVVAVFDCEAIDRTGIMVKVVAGSNLVSVIGDRSHNMV